MKYHVLWLCLLALTLGCSSDADMSTDTPPAAEPAASEPAAEEPAAEDNAGDVEVSEEILVKLDQADQLDGKADHEIGKCYVCALSMDGKPEHTVEVAGYKAHLCSEHCQEEFQANWETVVSTMDIPEKIEEASDVE